MYRISQAVVTLGLITGLLPGSSCSQKPSDLGDDAGRELSSTSPAPIDTVGELTDIGEKLYELEGSAVILAFGEPSDQTEGEEGWYHTFYQSSLAILAEAVRRDSTAAAAWYWYGQALASRAYRGFGEWNLNDQAAAVDALERAIRSFEADDPLRGRALTILERERTTLQALEGR